MHGGEGQRGYPVPFRESYEGGGLQSKYREMELGLAGVGEATPLATSRHASRHAAAQAAQRSQGKGSGQHYYYAPSTRLAEFTVAEHNARAAQAGHRLAEATAAGKVQVRVTKQGRTCFLNRLPVLESNPERDAHGFTRTSRRGLWR